MPSQDELPADIAGLTRLNAFELSNKRWQFDIGELSRLALRHDTWWHRFPRWARVGVPVLGVTIAAVAIGIVLLTSGSSPWKPCDPNISAFGQATSCPFAENTFYEYWKATDGKPTPGERSLRVWSPVTDRGYPQHCTDQAGEVSCTHYEGDRVRFSQASVVAYTKSEAKAYAASGRLGHPGR